MSWGSFFSSSFREVLTTHLHGRFDVPGFLHGVVPVHSHQGEVQGSDAHEISERVFHPATAGRSLTDLNLDFQVGDIRADVHGLHVERDGVRRVVEPVVRRAERNIRRHVIADGVQRGHLPAFLAVFVPDAQVSPARVRCVDVPAFTVCGPLSPGRV